MSDLFKQHFRATNGFDAAGGKIINVAKADRTVMSDGVNVEYLIQENTIQPWADDRGYMAGFAVHFEKRIWVSRVDIPAPIPPAKNTFKQTEWVSMRVDPKWEEYSSGLTNELPPGTYANVNTSSSAVTLTLPKDNVQPGDTIVVRDVGGQPGVNKALIQVLQGAPGADPLPILYRGQQVKEVLLTRPYSMFLFTYSRTGWNATLTDMSSIGRVISSATPDAAGDTAKGAQVQSSENIFRKYSGSKLTVKLPQWAAHGDIITFSEPDGQTPLYHFTIKSYSASSADIGSGGTKEMTFKGRGGGQIVFDGPNNLWVVDSADFRSRLQVITADINLQPNGAVSVFGADNTTQKTITITLPTNISVGDTAFVSMEYMRKGQTVVIKASTGDKIATSVGLLQFPRRSEYPPDGAWVMNDQISFNGTTSYPTDIELAYIEEAGSKYWIVVENKPTVERVDAKDNTTRARVGVIALANQDEVNATSGYQKEKAVTPETLAGRTAEEGRTGIAKISTNSQATANSNTTLNDDTIMTPKKVDARTATEARRGVAYVASQGDTNTGTDDTKMITPKKLNARVSSETLTGILALVKVGGAPNAPTTTRSTPGTNIFNFNDHERAITPKTLREFKATEKACGIVFVASEAEVLNGKASDSNTVVVTPETLHAKVAKTDAIGLIQIATQAQANAMANASDKLAITPATLNGRAANETQTGIARFATQDEFDGNTAGGMMVSTSKIATFFKRADRLKTNAVSGLYISSGNLWDGLTLDIRNANETTRGTLEVADQGETDAGTADDKIITPKKLQAKKGTEGAYGIVKYGVQKDVNDGVLNNVAVSPVHLKYVIQTSADWRAQDTVRGTVRVANDAVAWTGDDVAGSDNVAKEINGYAVSPNGLKQALSHYLPIKAKAADSGKLDNLGSNQFIRKDVDQTVAGKLTLTKETDFNTHINVKGTVNANGGEVKIFATSSTANSHVRFLNTDGTERGIIYAKPPETAGNVQHLIVRVKGAAPDSGKEFIFANSGEFTAPVKVSTGTIHSNSDINTGSLYRVKNVAVLQLQDSDATVSLGNNSKRLKLLSNDANNIYALDESGNKSYKVLTEKNKDQLLDVRYVRSDGQSTMTGNLKINSASLVITGSESWYNPTNHQALSQAGSWTVEIKDAAKLTSLKGYAVPIRAPNPIDPSVEIVIDYEYKTAGGGLLSQVGVTANYTYQVWTPYPKAGETAEKNFAHTMWTRVYNPLKGKFDDWMRVYTSALPPTSTDIGSPSSVSTKVKTLEVQEWIKIGPVKIYPDTATQTVKFEWVG